MTMPIKTQCPNCQAVFTLPQAQLDKADSKGRCGRCQQFFLLNEHIVTPTTTPPIDDNSVVKSKPVVKSKSSTPVKPELKKPLPEKKAPQAPTKTIDKAIDDDMLIHDDMEIDEPQDSPLEYDSLDDMNAWITQFDDIEPAIPAIEPAPAAPLSKEDDNKKHVNENAWLESLLAEEKGDSTAASGRTTSDSSLSKLLTDIGIPAQDKSRKTQSPTNQQPHTSSAPTRKRPLAATFLWSLGSLVLVFLLFAQYVVFNLNTLIKNPAHEARLQAICQIAACRLPSADITQFAVTDISHSASKVSDSATFSDIKAVLVNQSAEAQLFPNLKVSIYAEDTLIGEFIALPADYLLSPQAQLAAQYDKPVMFTVPVPAKQMSKVIMDAIY